MAISGPIGKVQQNCFCALPILLCTFCCANTMALRFLFRLQAKRAELKSQIFAIGTANAPSFSYRHGKCTQLCLKAQGSAADYILRQYYWHYVAHATGPILPEHA
jgi:hypothetical protein